MNFRTATLLVLGMFGSFAVVITTMMFLFWSPSSKKPERKQPEMAEKVGPAPGKSDAASGKPSIDLGAVSDPKPAPPNQNADTTVVEQDPEREEVVPASSPPSASPGALVTGQLASPAPGRMTQKNLEIEQGEMKQLRAEMERRLKEQTLNKEKKLDQLAKRCETLEAGEAVQILTILEDADLGKVLQRMSREKALQISALLTRLGRGNAISLK